MKLEPIGDHNSLAAQISFTFSKNLRLLMAEHNVKNHQLSEATGISETTMSRITRNEGSMTSIQFQTLSKIALAFEVEVYELLKP